MTSYFRPFHFSGRTNKPQSRPHKQAEDPLMWRNWWVAQLLLNQAPSGPFPRAPCPSRVAPEAELLLGRFGVMEQQAWEHLHPFGQAKQRSVPAVDRAWKLRPGHPRMLSVWSYRGLLCGPNYIFYANLFTGHQAHLLKVYAHTYTFKWCFMQDLKYSYHFGHLWHQWKQHK